MKKLAFLLASVLYSLSCLSQQKITLSEKANIELPTGMKKISKEQALSFAGEKFNNDKILLNSISKRRFEHIYKDENVLISLFTDNNSVKEGHLTDMKRGLDEMFRLNSTYKSDLKKINNNSILVVNYIIGNVAYYRFFSYNASNSKSVTGILEFDKIDFNKASTILDQIFNSLSIKD